LKVTVSVHYPRCTM